MGVSILRKKSIQVLIHVIFPLMLGSMVYIFIRSGSFIAFEKIDPGIKIDYSFSSNLILTYLIYSFPDFCWSYAFLSFQIGIIWGGVKKISHTLKFIIYIFPILTEVMQYFHLIRGTADWADVISYLFAIFINIYVWK